VDNPFVPCEFLSNICELIYSSRGDLCDVLVYKVERSSVCTLVEGALDEGMAKDLGRAGCLLAGLVLATLVHVFQ
jgi:hypothetical protein